MLLAIAAAGPVAAAGVSSGLAWSPDGRWIAYVVEAPETAQSPRSGWFFGAGDRPTPPPGRDSAHARLWASRVGATDSVLLDNSPGRLTPPGWSPDGRSIAFGRWTSGGAGPGRFEVVSIGREGRRVLSSRPVDPAVTTSGRWAQSPAAWSPDGRYLAVPQADPPGVAVLRAETGQVVKSLEAASFPAWSPDGSRLLFVAHSSDGDHLEYLDTHFGASRHVAAVGQVDGPPVFARDGLSAFVLSRTRTDARSGATAERVDVVRLRLDDGRRVYVTNLRLESPSGRDGVLSGASFTLDRDRENILSTLAVDGQPSQVSWFRPREGQIYKKFPVLDQSLTATDLNLSPAGGVLALRLGGPGLDGLPILLDLDTMVPVPLAPDAPARAAWSDLLLRTAERLLRESLPNLLVAGRPVGRPVPLPIPGELDPNAEPTQRLRRLGRTGHPLSERGGDVRLIFDYLREAFPDVLADLDAVDRRAEGAERRLRLVAIRAQVFVGLGEFDRARGTLAYLAAIEPTRTTRFAETTSLGTIFTERPPHDLGWPAYALGRVDRLEREAEQDEKAVPIGPTDHRNPDAPRFELEAPAVPPAPEAVAPIRRRVEPVPFR